MYPDPGMSPRLRRLMDEALESGNFDEFHKVSDAETKAYKKAFFADGAPPKIHFDMWPFAVLVVVLVLIRIATG